MGDKRIIKIFEDTPEEQEKVRRVAEQYGLNPHIYPTVQPALVVDTLGVSDQEESDKLIERTNEIWKPSDGTLVGIITDLYIPFSDSEKDSAELREPNEPRGIAIYINAIKRGIPCLICTDSIEHGARSEWIKYFGEVLHPFGLNPMTVGKDWDFAMKIITNVDKIRYQVMVKRPIERYQRAIQAVAD